MKVLKINPDSPEKTKILTAVDILRKGGTVVYPTDTVYGLGVNIFDDMAIEKVFTIKKRPKTRPISICIFKFADIDKIAYMGDSEEKIVKKILPGPYTVILRKKEPISSILTAGGDKVGIRIPEHRISRELSRKFPITTTSANISRGKPPVSVEEVLEQIGESVDLILNAGKCEKGSPSTVIDLTTSPPMILRKGPDTLF